MWGLMPYIMVDLSSRNLQCQQVTKDPIVIQQMDRRCVRPLDDAKVGRMHTWVGQEDMFDLYIF